MTNPRQLCIPYVTNLLQNFIKRSKGGELINNKTAGIKNSHDIDKISDRELTLRMLTSLLSCSMT
uniref:Uncharacterized protein n=1 Tax=Arundo donax TaxID=35708 RepID=A0A0A9DN75_ARUDO